MTTKTKEQLEREFVTRQGIQTATRRVVQARGVLENYTNSTPKGIGVAEKLEEWKAALTALQAEMEEMMTQEWRVSPEAPSLETTRIFYTEGMSYVTLLKSNVDQLLAYSAVDHDVVHTPYVYEAEEPWKLAPDVAHRLIMKHLWAAGYEYLRVAEGE